ncbi:MAG: efflux RND transporter periplasmic adaptor subunit [Vicinamibacterales bacterium]
MDIATPEVARRKRTRRLAYSVLALAVLAGATLGVSRLKPAAPGVDKGTLWIDAVKRGPMLRQVRGLGTLVPEDIRWIPATTQGRVERIRLRPGTAVTADSVILELSNPSLQLELQDALLRVRAAEAAVASLRVQLENDYLAQQAVTTGLESDLKRAQMQAEVNDQLAAKGLVSALTIKQSQLDVQERNTRAQLSRKQVASHAETMKARLDGQQAEVDLALAVLRLKQQQVDDLQVKAGVDGVLQVVPVEVGQQVTPGTNLARVANPAHLKAELKIAETQAKDVLVGQVASVDTHNGVIEGRVLRIDPSVQNGTVTVDVALTGELPKGARPDLSVDGTIELERLSEVVYVGRPAFGQEASTVSLFKLQPDGEATRVQVKLGRSSVSTVEVLDGLAPGDQVVLSDMSQWDGFDRVRLQ